MLSCSCSAVCLLGFMSFVPEASVLHLGIFREEKSLHPVVYYEKLPKVCETDICYVLDPIIATAGTAIAAIQTLKEWGVKEIHYISIIASKSGLNAILTKFPDTFIHVASVDKVLPDGTLVPGIGDVGNRLFKL